MTRRGEDFDDVRRRENDPRPLMAAMWVTPGLLRSRPFFLGVA